MLRYRLPSGLLMIAALLGLMWLDNKLGARGYPPGLAMLGIVLSMAAFASLELATLLRAKWGHCSRMTLWLSAVVGAVMVFALPLIETPLTAVAVFGSGIAGVLFAAMFRHSFVRKQTQGAANAGASATFALVYLGILPGIYLLIRQAGYSAWVIAAILLIVKACDIGAYFTGRLIGRHKLIPWLSPGKTWEGLAGGMLASAAVAAGCTAWGNAVGATDGIPLWYAAVAGLVLGFLGQVGDLLASLLKRDAGIKDWAATVPGFGGVMDVADSLLIVAPVAYWLLTLAPKGG
jgi:phosphatidate cytidylyltransferase